VPLTSSAPAAPQGDRPERGHGQIVLGSVGTTPIGARAAQLTHMYRLSDPMLSELGLDALLLELLDRTKEALRVDTAAILMLDEEGNELVARAARGLEEEVERGVRIPLGGGFAGRIAAERVPIFIADVDHADIVNPILREKGLRSLLGAPLIVEGRVTGVMHVGTLRPREFTDDDAALLQLAASRAGPAIERARLFDELDREHRSAISLQRSLLPERLPDVPGLDIAARYLPSVDEVGGDWYDVVELPGGVVGLAIGDVAGHGVRAAALMGQLRTGLRAYALEGHGPGETLKRLNRLLQSIGGRGMATAAYAVFSVETGALRIASAGHPPPVLISASGEARLMEVSAAPPLGTLPYPTHEEHEVSLGPGETVLMYTDGLVERRGESLTAGLERLRATAGVVASAEEICQRVIDALVPALGAPDDVALVALRNAPVETDLRLRVPADPRMLSQVRQMLRRWLRSRGARAEEIAAMTLACGEACANAIEHAYAPGHASFELEAMYAGGVVTLAVRDTGSWRAPRGEHRGRGLRMIEATVDELDVRAGAHGTEVLMRRKLAS
jgi:anti-sigma regulatory factor (Ser/Thr protein kinase)/putative methionine-R-sulfoxide reductase with GAF domain